MAVMLTALVLALLLSGVVAWVDDMARKWGPESNLYRVRVLGEFPESEDDAMIPLAWIEEAVQRYRDMQAAGTLPPPDRLSLDVATGVGRDAGVVAVCGGNGCLALESSTEADTMKRWKRRYIRRKVSRISGSSVSLRPAKTIRYNPNSPWCTASCSRTCWAADPFRPLERSPRHILSDNSRT